MPCLPGYSFRSIKVEDTQKDSPEVISAKHPDSFIPNRITEQEATDKNFVKADDVNVLATQVVYWHGNACNQVQHVLNLDNSNPADPQKIGIRVYEPDHPDADENGFRLLLDSELIPFKHGMRYALDQFEELPFQYVPTNADGDTLPGYGANNVDPNEPATEEVQQEAKDSGA